MELRNLLTYCKVCESMSFSKAADQLGYAQSTVTMQIAQLEDELGVKLFDRNGKRIRTNAKGQELLVSPGTSANHLRSYIPYPVPLVDKLRPQTIVFTWNGAHCRQLGSCF